MTLDIAHFTFEEGVGGDIAGDFLTGDGNCGGIPVAQLAADIREGVVGLLPNEVHGQAAG